MINIFLPIKDRPAPKTIDETVKNLKKIHKSRKKINKKFSLYKSFGRKSVDKALLSFKKPDLSFKLRGRVAGKAHLHSNLISLNCQLINTHKHKLEIQTETLAHEYAHLLAFHLSNNFHIKITTHGSFWKEIVTLLGFTPSIYHSMKVISYRRRKKRYKAKCKCKHDNKFTLTPGEYNKVQRDLIWCNSCNCRLKANPKFFWIT